MGNDITKMYDTENADFMIALGYYGSSLLLWDNIYEYD